MPSTPVASDDSQPRQWTISTGTLILSADSKRPLAVLNGRHPLLLPPGTVLQFDDPASELMVTVVRVILGEGGGIVCAEAEPVQGRYRASAARRAPTDRPGHLRPVPSRPPRWSHVRPGNG